MNVGLLSKSLASVVAVGLMAAWMTPPTRPKPVAPSPLAGLAPVKPMDLPPETAEDTARAAMPPPTLAVETVPYGVSLDTSEARPAVMVVPSDEQGAPKAREDVSPDAAVRADDDADDPGHAREQDRARYEAGFRWARNHEVEDARQCPPARGDPAEQGCLDYASAQDRSSGDGND